MNMIFDLHGMRYARIMKNSMNKTYKNYCGIYVFADVSYHKYVTKRMEEQNAVRKQAYYI